MQQVLDKRLTGLIGAWKLAFDVLPQSSPNSDHTAPSRAVESWKENLASLS